MKNNDKSTRDLYSILEGLNPDQLSEYIQNNKDNLIDGERDFYHYFKEVVQKKNIKLTTVYRDANLSEKYGQRILSMDAHTKNRDVILRLCIAGHFNLDEMNRALKLYGFNSLYPRDPRDACIILNIQKRNFDVYNINDELVGQGLQELILEE